MKMTVFKYGVAVLLGLVVVSLVVIVGLVVVVNPNDYKEEISHQVKRATGYELTLAGNLEWSFYPVLGFKTQNLSLSVSGQPSNLLSLDSVSLGLRLLPLLKKKVEAGSLVLSGVTLNLKVDERGRNNWLVEGGESKSKQAENATTPSQNGASLQDLQIEEIRLEDIELVYVDINAEVKHSIELAQVSLKNVAFDSPIALSVDLKWQSPAHEKTGAQVDTQIDAQLNAALMVDKAFTLVQLSSANLKAHLSGMAQKPLELDASFLSAVNLTDDKLDLNIDAFRLGGLKGTSSVTVLSVSTEPKVQGRMNLSSKNLKGFLSELDIVLPESRNAEVLSSFELQAGFTSDRNQLQVNPINVKLDQSELSGTVSIVDFSNPFYGFDLGIDRIDLDDYLAENVEGEIQIKGEGESQKPNKPSHPIKVKELIPVELLRSLNLAGSAQVKSLTFQETQINDVVVLVKASKGDVVISPLRADLMQGSVAGEIQVDVKGAQPQLKAKIDITNLELSELARPFLDQDLASGRASLSLNSSAQGNDMDTLLNAAVGQLNLEVLHGMLHGVNLNKIVIDALHQQLGSFEKVFPHYEKQLPKELKENTDINQLFANAKVENGHLIMPEFTFASDSGEVQAEGDVDLLSQKFAYNFNVHLKEIDRNKYLKGTQWPVRCIGSLSEPVQDWCRPDSKKMKRILSKAAKLALKDKSAKELGDKVGLDVETQNQLEDELEEKLKQEEARAKRKLQEKLDKWLKKKSK